MSLKLYELVGTDALRPFSPFCWRTRMALAHKGLDFESIPWRFTEKDVLGQHAAEKVPVLLDGDTPISDSFAIAKYLEETWPDLPSLFGGEGGVAMARMLNWWGDLVVVGGIFPMVARDIHDLLRPEDQSYFRTTREARLGNTLEAIEAGRDALLAGFRKSLDPLRLTLKTQPFIGGEAPNYADYIAFGGFQWARTVSPFKLLTPDDAVYSWRGKLLDAFDGLARKSPGYEV